MIDLNNVFSLLYQHKSEFEEEIFFRKLTLEFVEKHQEKCWQRQNLAGHLTASAWVFDEPGDQALLIHHRVLDKWFQPGGHVETEDYSLLAAAQRELMEECGLRNAQPVFDHVFDLDIHLIPAKGEIPEHPHYDIRFLFQGVPGHTRPNLSEVRDFRWHPLESLLKMPLQQSVRRMAVKCGKQIFKKVSIDPQ